VHSIDRNNNEETLHIVTLLDEPIIPFQETNGAASPPESEAHASQPAGITTVTLGEGFASETR
jgi:hypothetical protein